MRARSCNTVARELAVAASTVVISGTRLSGDDLPIRLPPSCPLLGGTKLSSNGQLRLMQQLTFQSVQRRRKSGGAGETCGESFSRSHDSNIRCSKLQK